MGAKCEENGCSDWRFAVSDERARREGILERVGRRGDAWYGLWVRPERRSESLSRSAFAVAAEWSSRSFAAVRPKRFPVERQRVECAAVGARSNLRASRGDVHG